MSLVRIARRGTQDLRMREFGFLMRKAGVHMSGIMAAPVGAKEKSPKREPTIMNPLSVFKRLSLRRRKMIKLVIGIVVGAAFGFAYYRFIGCASGTCPITGNRFVSTLYGAIIGALLSGFGT